MHNTINESMNTLQVQNKSDILFLLFGCDSHWTISKHSSGMRTEKYVNNLKFHCTTPSNDQSALITYNTNQIINQHFLGSTHTGQSVNTLQEPEQERYVNIIRKLRKTQNSFYGWRGNLVTIFDQFTLFRYSTVWPISKHSSGTWM